MGEDRAWGDRVSPALSYSNTQNHHFGGFDQRGSPPASLETHLLCSIGGDDGSDVLFADRQSDLSEQAAVLDVHNPADQLVAAADSAEIAAPSRDVAALESLGYEPVDFTFRNAMMTARRFRGADLAVVNPLLQRGITDAQDVCGFAGRQKSLHGGSCSVQDTTDSLAISIRFYTFFMARPAYEIQSKTALPLPDASS